MYRSRMGTPALPIELVQDDVVVATAAVTDGAFVDDVVRVALAAAPFVVRVPLAAAADPAARDPRGGIAISLVDADDAFRARLVGERLSALPESLGHTVCRAGRPRELWVTDAPHLPALMNDMPARDAVVKDGALEFSVESLLGLASGDNLMEPGRTLFAAILSSRAFGDCYRVAEELGDGLEPSADRTLEGRELRLLVLEFAAARPL